MNYKKIKLKNAGKKSVIGIDKILKWAIAGLIVASVLIFLFKVDILNYLKNLPGYTVPEDEEVDLTDDSQLFIVAKIVGNKIMRCVDNTCSDYKETFLYTDVTEIFIKIPGLFNKDIKVGDFVGKKIDVLNEVFYPGDFEDLYSKYDEIPSGFFLRKLDGAYYSGVNNMIYRKNEIYSIYIGYEMNLNNVPLGWTKLSESEDRIVFMDKEYHFVFYVTKRKDNSGAIIIKIEKILEPNTRKEVPVLWAEK